MDTSGRGSVSPGREALPVGELARQIPGLAEHLNQMGVPIDGHEESSLAFLCEEAGLDPRDVLDSVGTEQAVAAPNLGVERIDIIGGSGKGGAAEPVALLTLEPGQAIALVGATGSGKSQLLADVESMAQGDSPSGRKILLNGEEPPDELRWSPAARPVAQVAQGMRFLLDVSVGEFLEMHANARGADDPVGLAGEVIKAACGLCGEAFTTDTQLATLSGGQTRALMIADAAMVSASPIILVDEIENAGIDREKALTFLVGQGKIALMATHDPLLALRADRRVILSNGAMQEVLQRSPPEQTALSWLEGHDKEVMRMREQLRQGQRLTKPGGALQAWADNTKQERSSALRGALRDGARLAGRALMRRMMMHPEDLDPNATGT
jgi:ABC-type lipoprotein export system ATPase subunit